MKLNFRQGIVEYQIPTFLGVHYPAVDLVVSDTPTIVTFAVGATDYLLVEPKTIVNAWGPTYLQQDQWLYWDIDMRTGIRTFGITTAEPIVSATPPLQPVGDQHWFDTSSNKMMLYYNGAWQQRVRVFACKLAGGAVPVGVGEQGFTGTQAGLDVVSYSGPILYNNGDGLPILTADGTFLTTEDNLRTASVNVATVKLASLILPAMAEQNLAAYTVVKFTDFGKIVHGDAFTGSQPKQYGIIQSDAVIGDIVNVTMSGVISSPSWDWTSVGVNGYLYPDAAGALSAVQTVPNQTPIATIVDKQTIVLGSPVITINNPPVGLATATQYGVSRLSVPADIPTDPIVVGTNDPRLISQPITFITGLQQSLDSKLAIAGGTMTGYLYLNADPVQPMQAATKEYVDSHLTTIAEPLNQIVVGTGPSVTATAFSTMDPLTGEVSINYNSTTKSQVDIVGGANVVIAAPSTAGTEVSANGNTVTVLGGNANGATGNGGDVTIQAGSVLGSTPYDTVRGGDIVLHVGSGNVNPAIWKSGSTPSYNGCSSDPAEPYTLPIFDVVSTVTNGTTAVVLGSGSFSGIESGSYVAAYGVTNDGVNWSAYPSPVSLTNTTTEVVGYSNGTWMVFDGATIATSPDLINWSTAAFPLSSPAGNGRWVTLASRSGNTAQYLVLSPDANANDLPSGSIMVAQSTDGVVWNSTPLTSVPTGTNCAVAMAIGPSNTCTIVLAQPTSGGVGVLSSIVTTGNTSTTQPISGIPQTVIGNAVSATISYGPIDAAVAVHYIGGKFIMQLPQVSVSPVWQAATRYPVFYQSIDGIHWSFASTIGFADAAGAMYINNGLLEILVAESTTANYTDYTFTPTNWTTLSSMDGITWTATPSISPLNNSAYSVSMTAGHFYGPTLTMVGSYGVIDLSTQPHYTILRADSTAAVDFSVSHGSVKVMRGIDRVFEIDANGKHLYQQTGPGEWGLSTVVSESGNPEWLSPASRMPTYTWSQYSNVPIIDGQLLDFQLPRMSSTGLYAASEYGMDGTYGAAVFPQSLIIPNTLIVYAGANSSGNATIPVGFTTLSSTPAGVVAYRLISVTDAATYGSDGGWALSTTDAAMVTVFGRTTGVPSIVGGITNPPVTDPSVVTLSTSPVVINAPGVMMLSIFLNASGFTDDISTASYDQTAYVSNGGGGGGVVMAINTLNNNINETSPIVTMSIASNPVSLYSQGQSISLIIS